MRTNRNFSLFISILCLMLSPLTGYSQVQSDCAEDNESPFCMVTEVSIKGDKAAGGVSVKFPRIAYDKCSTVKVVDYYLIAQELKVESGHFLSCGTHEMQTFVVDEKGNYSICEFTVKVNCAKPDNDGKE